jgi:hypothetical protein
LAAAVSAVALSMVVAFAVAVSPVVISTAVTFVVAISITGSLIMSSSGTSAFQGGGAGAIRMDIMVVMVTAITHTITMATQTVRTATTVAAVTDTAMAIDPTCAVMPLNQVAPCIANNNHGVM